MGRVFLIVIDFMERRLAAANMVRDIFNIGKASGAGRDVQAGNVDTDTVSLLEQVRCGEDFDGVFVDFPGHHRFLGLPGQRVPGFPRLRPFRVQGSVGCFQPAPGQLPLR